MENQREYTLQGIDVSRYQGTIDWEKAAKGKILRLSGRGTGGMKTRPTPA